MSPLFTAIVVVLALLAVMGIVVGVANDAVNFLNSALGSKVAPRRVILWVAAAGILVGTLTSSGMMEVARSGVFYPGQFSFREIMMLFLGMMLGNVAAAGPLQHAGTAHARPPCRWSSDCWAPPWPPRCSASPATPGPRCTTSRSSSTRARRWSSSRRILLSVALAFAAGNALHVHLAADLLVPLRPRVPPLGSRVVRHLARRHPLFRAVQGTEKLGADPLRRLGLRRRTRRC